MRRLTLLHTNDIHGREEGIARIATLVERIRAESPHPVLYLDAGDVEEPKRRLSNLTKGAALHRLLTVAGCEAHTAGNATWMKYGPQEFPAHAAAAGSRSCSPTSVCPTVAGCRASRTQSCSTWAGSRSGSSGFASR